MITGSRGQIFSLFLEEELTKADQAEWFLQKCIQVAQKGPTRVDKLLAINRIFSLALLQKDPQLAETMKDFLELHDLRLKKFSALFYAVLTIQHQGINVVLNRLQVERNDAIKWGLIVGIAVNDWITTPAAPSLAKFQGLRDELIIGLILLNYELLDVCIPLLLSAIALG